MLRLFCFFISRFRYGQENCFARRRHRKRTACPGLKHLSALEGACLSRQDQIVYYIPGVGTEGFKPLAMLDGATGFGVPSNVRKLYRFLSWNWEPGAAIYMFGFSRGAFTIRMLIDLIAKQGLLPTEFNGRRVSHQEMVRNSDDAWRAFCAQDDERKKNIWVNLAFAQAARRRSWASGSSFEPAAKLRRS